MARPRSTPPGTTFGVWLAEWLESHPGVTFEAFATDVGVTKSAVSQWIAARRQAKVKLITLKRIHQRTGKELRDLTRMVYGEEIEEEPSVSPDLLEAIEQRMRVAFREELSAALRELRAAENE